MIVYFSLFYIESKTLIESCRTCSSHAHVLQSSLVQLTLEKVESASRRFLVFPFHPLNTTSTMDPPSCNNHPSATPSNPSSPLSAEIELSKQTQMRGGNELSTRFLHKVTKGSIVSLPPWLPLPLQAYTAITLPLS